VSPPGDELARSEVGDLELAAGLALAAACFAATFRGPRSSFWSRMTTTGALLGTMALQRRPELRRLRFRPRHLAEGTAIAAGLYLVFGVGDRVARRVMPAGAEDISAIYDLRSGQSRWLIATRLAAVIAPAEELFWRGWLQRSLAGHRGRWRAGALAAGAYGAVHMAAGNPTLLAAASVAGASWSALAALGVDMESLVVSHLVWDVVIFLVAPTSRRPDTPPGPLMPGAPGRRLGPAR
jgi:membrane protease YdiL (CAAX protease family)